MEKNLQTFFFSGPSIMAFDPKARIKTKKVLVLEMIKNIEGKIMIGRKASVGKQVMLSAVAVMLTMYTARIAHFFFHGIKAYSIC